MNLIEAIWNNAAQIGLLNIIIDLHINNFPGCTSNTMDYAAMNGNINLVHFLFHHKKQHCSHKAMYAACAYNHIKVVKFLYKNLYEYCDINNSILIAKANKNQNIVLFLENEEKTKLNEYLKVE